MYQRPIGKPLPSLTRPLTRSIGGPLPPFARCNIALRVSQFTDIPYNLLPCKRIVKRILGNRLSDFSRHLRGQFHVPLGVDLRDIRRFVAKRHLRGFQAKLLAGLGARGMP